MLLGSTEYDLIFIYARLKCVYTIAASQGHKVIDIFNEHCLEYELSFKFE